MVDDRERQGSEARGACGAKHACTICGEDAPFCVIGRPMEGGP